jgi:hypothetical protein
MGSFMSAPVWAQGSVDVPGVKIGFQPSQGLNVREAEKQLNTEVRFGLVAVLTDELLTGGIVPPPGAGSSDRRNTCIKTFCRGFKAQRLAGPFI